MAIAATAALAEALTVSVTATVGAETATASYHSATITSASFYQTKPPTLRNE
jgi:hypothetical protein